MNDPSTPDDETRFGPNAWLIEEKYRQFQEFPDSVGEPWRHFLEDRDEGEGNGGARRPPAADPTAAGTGPTLADIARIAVLRAPPAVARR